LARIGLGSVGLDIFGLLTELMLDRGSLVVDNVRVSLDFLPNHFVGFDKKWVIPDGELERD